MKKFFFILTTLTFLVINTSYSAEKDYYPEKYRNWQHVKSMVIQQGHPLYDAFGGIHHIYANKKAMKGYMDKKGFPDGSIIVFDLLDAKTENNAIVEGSRKVIGIMVKDSKKFKDTGGWGFFAYKGDTKEQIVKDMKTACFECHASQKDNGYVFSTYRK
jgi:hypothetical protein